MRFLRTNTAVIITVGPFFDKGDGVTIETALTITNERITLTADTDDNSAPTNILDNVTGATSGTANDLNYITGNDAGMMQMELSAANTNRLGRMMLSITDAANHVPVFHEFMVLPAMIYDALILGTDRLDTNITHVADTAQTARDIGASVLLSSGVGTGQVKLASGYVAPNWGDVGNPTTAVDLSGTTIKTTQKVDVETIKTQAVTCAAGVTVLASVGTAATNTAQTGDSYALANGVSGFAAIKAETASLLSKLLKYVQLLYRKDAAIATDNATELTAINADGGSGAGSVDNTTDSQQGIRDTAPLGTAMRGTDAALLAASYTAPDNAGIANIQSRVPAALTGDGNIKADTLRVGGTLQTAGDLAGELAAIEALIGTPAADLAADIAALLAVAQAILADTGTDGVVVAAASKTGYRLSATGVDDVLDEVATSLIGKPNTLRGLIWFLRQVSANKLQYDKTTDQLVLFEDDGSTAKLTHAMTDDATEATRGGSA